MKDVKTSGLLTGFVGADSVCNNGDDPSTRVLVGVGDGRGDDSISSSSDDSTCAGIPFSLSFRSVSDICRENM